MATDRQVEANRLNALKSTGPKTVEGKDRSRRNALTHGLAAESGMVDDRFAGVHAARRAVWAGELKPVGETANFALDMVVSASIRLEQCDDALNDVIALHSVRAQAAWDEDRRLEAAEVAGTLAKDPMIVSCRLESTWHGCELMIGLWGRLAEALFARRAWNDAETARALDLLGVPRDLREGATALESFDETPAFNHLSGLINREIDRLKTTMDRLILADDVDRRQAETGNSALLSKSAQLLMRYERDSWRRYHAGLKAIRTQQPGQPSHFAPAPQPAPSPKPQAAPPAKPRPVATAEDSLFESPDPRFAPMTGSSYVNISATAPRTTPSRN